MGSMKTINLEYDFDKTYYYNKMISIPTIVKCLYCENGRHKRIGDGEEVECPMCEGKCEVDTGSGSIKEEPAKCFLNNISIIISKEIEDIKYHFFDEYDDNVFGTIYDDIDKCIGNKIKGFMGYSPVNVGKDRG